MSDLKINKKIYQNVPSVSFVDASGGDVTYYDTSQADATPERTMAGDVGYNSNGKFVGTLSVPHISQDPETNILSIL